MPLFAHALILDDARFMRVVIRDAIGSLCGQIDEAGDASTALRLARQQTYDLATIDLSIDHHQSIQGLEVLRALRQDRQAIHIVVISALDQDWIRDDVLAAGASCYITKPFLAADLRHRLQTLVEAEA